jgi:hypothetical protein
MGVSAQAPVFRIQIGLCPRASPMKPQHEVLVRSPLSTPADCPMHVDDFRATEPSLGVLDHLDLARDEGCALGVTQVDGIETLGGVAGERYLQRLTGLGDGMLRCGPHAVDEHCLLVGRYALWRKRLDLQNSGPRE